MPTIQGVHLDSVFAESSGGANVLCLHGLCAGSWTFEEFLPMIAARGYHAHALSYRGHPPSEPLRSIGRASVADYARDASVVARALDRPIVVGHSLGGLVALMLAGRNLVRAAALLSPAPPRGIPVLSVGLAVRMVNYLPAMLFSGALRMRQGDIDAIVLNKVPVSERATIRSRFVPDSGTVARQVTLGRYRIPARAVRVPVMVVGSSHDRFIPPSVSRRVAHKYKATFHLAENHGHFFFGEPHWRDEANVMLNWIDSLPRVVRDASAEGIVTAPREPRSDSADSFSTLQRDI